MILYTIHLPSFDWQSYLNELFLHNGRSDGIQMGTTKTDNT